MACSAMFCTWPLDIHHGRWTTCDLRCADLTGGYYPIRTSAFSCCAAEPCNLVLKYVQMSSVAEVIQWQVNISDREN